MSSDDDSVDVVGEAVHAEDALELFLQMHGVFGEGEATFLSAFRHRFQIFCDGLALNLYVQNSNCTKKKYVDFRDPAKTHFVTQLLQAKLSRMAASSMECTGEGGPKSPKYKKNTKKIMGLALSPAIATSNSCKLKVIESNDVQLFPKGRQVTAATLSLSKFEDVGVNGINKVASGQLGSGTFGAVFKGVLSPGVVSNDAVPCAVKVFKNSVTSSAATAEAQKILSVAGLPHVLQMIGGRITTGDGKINYLIYPLYDSGDLSHILKTGKLSYRSRVGISIDIAKAGTLLQLSGLIHGDIKANNILMQNDGRVILGDFGMAQAQQGLQKGKTRGGNHNGRFWLPPEWGTSKADWYTDLFAISMVVMRVLSPNGGVMPQALEAHHSFSRCPRVMAYLEAEPSSSWATLFRLLERACSLDCAARQSVSYVHMFKALESVTNLSPPACLSDTPRSWSVGRVSGTKRHKK